MNTDKASENKNISGLSFREIPTQRDFLLMRCSCKKFSPIIFLFIFLFLGTIQSTPVRAVYSSLSLSPSEGIISPDNTAITVNVNSGADEFVGIDTTLSFTGPLEYVSATGAKRCESFQVVEGSSSINIECFSFSHSEGEVYSGELATLYFRATGTGESTFTFTAVDPEVTSKTGGLYILTSNSSVDPSTDSITADVGNTVGTLPETSIFDSSKGVFITGIFLLIFGLSFGHLYDLLENVLERRFSGDFYREKRMREKV